MHRAHNYNDGICIYIIIVYYYTIEFMGFTNQQLEGPHLVGIFFGDIPWFDAQVQHAEDAENLRQGPKDVAGKSQW